MAEKIDASSSNIPDYRDYFDLLIITATPTEKNEVHKYLQPITGQEGIIRIQKDQYTYYLGIFGHYNAIHVATGAMGMSGRTASIHTAMTAIALWNPKVVLMVGIAFGINPEKVRIGDVLISERVVNYEPYRANADGSETARGTEGPASTLLLDRYRSIENWEHTISYDEKNYKAKQVPGLMLSGEILLDDPELKAKLVEKYPNAIGGEMEGAGIYTACDLKVPHWIIVKAVCDYGDGTKGSDPNKDLYQELAVQAAVSLSNKVFSEKYSFEDIGLYSGTLPESAASTAPEKKKLELYLKEQLNRQLGRQKASQKYIPSTFVEVEDNKEMMRYFCAPMAFLPKILTELSVMEFGGFNQRLVKEGFSEFSFDVSQWADGISKLDLSNLGDFEESLRAYLEIKENELEKPPVKSYDLRSYSYKVSYIRKQLKWFSRKVCLIKEDAGQGKTNFICDLVDNFIQKREIPALFLLGTELNPNDIRGSILKKVFPDSTDITFALLLSEIQALCNKSNQPFILIIDGLNENANPDEFCKNLEDFIAEITEYSFIRVILSCRSEYYNKHFTAFDKSAFSPFMDELRHLRIHRDSIAANKIFWGYMDYFNIKLESLSNVVFNQLTENFLLLRIFCDSHKGEKIPYLGTIYKQTLFSRYYQNKVGEITKRMNEDDEFKVMGKIDIRRFLEKLVQYMIEHRTYENIPLDDLLTAEDNRKVYVRFLDENILVRRDPKADASMFEDLEVVNFTFDEFRDFLLADYLVTKIYPQNKKTFSDFLENEINPSSRILEGCGTFLFYIVRKTEDTKLKQIVESQKWFPHIFLKCIFNIEDQYVTQKDRQAIFAYIVSKGRPAISMFYHFLYRDKISDAPNLNLDHYMTFLRELPQQDFDRVFKRMFVDTGYAMYGEIDQDDFLGEYSTILEQESPITNYKKFEILIYMFDNDQRWKVFPIYEKFYHRFPDIAKAQLKIALGASNTQLVNSINRFCRRYDISL